MKGRSEAEILREARKAINLDGRARVLRNSVGFDDVRKVHYGLGVGSADLVGFLLDGSARVFALEVKSARGRVSEEQKAWLSFVQRCGGFAAVVRSEVEALEAVERALRGGRK